MGKYATVSGEETLTIEYPREYNAAIEFIDRHVAQGRGERVAVIDCNGATTYASLAERVNRAGNALLTLGLPPESRVLMCMLDSVDFVAVFWGAIKAGLIPVPVNTLLTEPDYDYMLRDSRAQALVVSDALWPCFENIVGHQLRLQSVLVTGDSVPAGQAGLNAALNGAAVELDPAPTTCDDVAFWLYTSGSTGAPKGGMHLHRSLVYTAASYGERVVGIGADDVVYSAAKLFFAYGLGNGMTFPFYAGGTVVLLDERPTPAAVMQVMSEHQPTVFFGVPTLYGAMLADSSVTPENGSAMLRLCVSAGEALPQPVAEQWQSRFGLTILDGIGTTELLHIFLSNRPDRQRHETSGVAVPGYTLRVLDEQGLQCGVDEVGELVVNGGSAAVAYWNQRDKSLATFQGPWTRTGDKYTVDADGFFHYCGRTDDMLKVGGIWVSPFEVESALLSHDAVVEAAVVGQEDDRQLVKPKAFVVLGGGHVGDEQMAETLKAHVKNRLAHYKYPRWVEFVNELPKTATGKIQRFRLRC
jgi:benzoate-CoA ligase family protein